VFGRTLARLQDDGVAFEAVLPTMPHLEAAVREGVKSWKVAPRIVLGEPDKRAAFRSARAALAKSGTVTLELALSGVPMVAAYRTGGVEAWILLRLIKVQSVILANLVLGENIVPEFLQAACTPGNLVRALRPLLGDTPERTRQLEAFGRLDAIMSTGKAPSVGAADIVLAAMRKGRR
jgi:lipid-A-disaccharide synthase